MAKLKIGLVVGMTLICAGASLPALAGFTCESSGTKNWSVLNTALFEARESDPTKCEDSLKRGFESLGCKNVKVKCDGILHEGTGNNIFVVDRQSAGKAEIRILSQTADYYVVPCIKEAVFPDDTDYKVRDRCYVSKNAFEKFYSVSKDAKTLLITTNADKKVETRGGATVLDLWTNSRQQHCDFESSANCTDDVPCGAGYSRKADSLVMICLKATGSAAKTRATPQGEDSFTPSSDTTTTE